MTTPEIDIRAEARSSRWLSVLLILVTTMLSIGLAIQRTMLTDGFVPSAFAASAVPSLGAGLAGNNTSVSSGLTSPFRFTAPASIRRSIPGRGGLLSGGLPPGITETDPTVAALTPAADGGAPGVLAAGGPVGLAGSPSPGGSGASSGGNTGGTGPLGGLTPGTLGGGGGAILPSAAVVPEPATWLMLFLGVFVLAWRLRGASGRRLLPLPV
ncbi:PEP-CTERM sorting domain-containing protein [Novosphingobium sp.]|uniref:PEP-CTERM sorting domain-containing protein n=1 Tax=Novosphingobium sp. TaxID=1874826 RepID=UPI0026399910|nr:PEP-CTERM sorting domain-containing protein [Novosphingobium sp.]